MKGIRATVHGITVGVLLGCASWSTQASSYGLDGIFGPSFWTVSPDQGTVYFGDYSGATSLYMLGPTHPALSDYYSYDGASYSPLPGDYELSFRWSFNSADALSAEAAYSYELPGGITKSVTIHSGGPGVQDIGTVEHVLLRRGTSLSFLFTTQNPTGKRTQPQVIIYDVRFQQVSVPDLLPRWWAGWLLLPCLLHLFFRKKELAGWVWR